VNRAWGAASLAYAALLLVAVAACDGLTPGDDVVIATVLSCSRRLHDLQRTACSGPGSAGGGPDDRSLFTVGNVLLALGSLGAAAAVAAVVCTAALLGKSGFLLR
jgi:hypothetical protein